jgi:hypothetical protein
MGGSCRLPPTAPKALEPAGALRTIERRDDGYRIAPHAKLTELDDAT